VTCLSLWGKGLRELKLEVQFLRRRGSRAPFQGEKRMKSSLKGYP
jgi:hypothetical protein